jgi:glycosyltransferase involved in cell wall biosynthesis
MRICHMTSVHRSDDVRIFVKECSSLAKVEDNEVFLVAPGTSRQENGVTVVGIGAHPKGRLMRMLKTRKKVYMAALNLDADIYHFHDPELLSFGLKLKKKGKIVVFDSHEDYPRQIREKLYIPKMLRNPIAFFYKKKEDRVCKELDGVIYPNLEHGIHPFEGRTSIAATVDNMPLLEELYDRYEDQGSKKDFSVCYIGTLSKARGISNLMDACYEAGVRLILGGIFSSEDYEREIRRKKSFCIVDYRGKFGREELMDILNDSSLGASTLLHIGQYKDMQNLATKVYEYMSMALPVLITDGPYEREVIQKHDFGILVNPENPSEMARAITELKNSPEKCKRLGENGRKAIKEVFNWGIEEQKLFQFYAEICENGKNSENCACWI